MAAAPRQPELQRHHGHPEPALAIWWRRLDVGLGDRQVGGRLVQVSVEQVIGGAHQGQLGVIRGSLGKARTSAWIVCACPSRVRLNEWSASSRAASDQSPAAWVWRMASTTWPWPVNQPAARRCSAGTSSRPRPAQLQPQEIPEQVVVAKPPALRVERHHEGVRVLELQQNPLRARAAGQQIGQLTVDPIEQEVPSSSCWISSGWRSSISASRYSATVRSLPENSATNRSGSG